MKVFLTGATGYIGRAIVKALHTNGYSVLGLARSDEAATKLKNLGVEPHQGDLKSKDSIIQGARQSDAVIHTASTNGSDVVDADHNAIDAILEALDGSGKPFAYTSGTLVYGDTLNEVVNENSPLNPLPFVSWRSAFEQTVLAANVRNIRSVIIRPSLVYGNGGGLPAMLIYPARQNGVALYPGTGENCWSTVHVDDLADLYVRAIKSATSGTVFNAAVQPPVSIKEFMEAVSFAAGAEGKTAPWSLEEARQAMGPFADGFVINQRISGDKAIKELGWNPQAPSLLEDLKQGSYRS
jgi:nucleoside-diphosphate-sugar epimerase